MGWGGRWKGSSGLGTHAHPWLIHVFKKKIELFKSLLQTCNYVLYSTVARDFYVVS